jgi:hypothetical protein
MTDLPMRSFSFLFRGLGSLVMAVCLCGALSVAAQGKPTPAQTAPSQTAPAKTAPVASSTPPAAKPLDLSKEALVFDKLYTLVREESDGTGTRQTTARIRIQADAGVKQMAVLTFTYTALSQQVDIGYVRVIKPNGTVVLTPDYNAQDMPADVTREAPMYSDIHQKHVAVKGLGVGDTLEYQVTLRTLKPEVPDQFWLEYTFEKDAIILDEQLDLDLPAAKATTVASADLQPTVTTANGRKLYHWASSNLARPDPDAPPKSTKHWKPSVQVTTFASWEQVGAWYASLQRDSLAVTPAIQARADALTKGLSGNDDKIRVLFNDVALHIHYVGLEFGIGRYQPHPADDVLSNEYGDCKDKHTLLASLLKAAGIEAWPVLISDSREPDPALPSPAQFDHVITLVPQGGKMLWMDSTEEVAPVGLLMDSLRDKQALAVPIGKPAYLETTPADAPTPRLVRMEAVGKLSSQGLFTGHIAQTTDGDVGMLFRSGFRRMPQSQWKELVQGIANSEGYAGEVSNPQVSEVERIAEPFIFSYDYTREKYYQWDDSVSSHWISPPLPAMGGELAPGVKEKKPADDPDLGSIGNTVYHGVLQLPEGWSMVAPKDVDLSESWLEYHAKYSFKNGTFTADRSLQIKKTKVPLEDWEKYLTFRRGMFDDLNHQTLIAPPGEANAQVIQNQIAGLGATEKARLDEMMDAAKPLREALDVLQATPPPTPETLAKTIEQLRKAVSDFEAKSLTLPADDAHSLSWARMLADAWSTLGWAALEAKDLPTAENYLSAAWHLSQDKTTGYLYGLLLEAKGQKDAAAHQYELASVTSAGSYLPTGPFSAYSVGDRIAASYKEITGKPLTATALKHGQYNGSLRAELDKQVEIHGITSASKVNGEALFSVSFEEGKPTKAIFLGGDKQLRSMAGTLETRRFLVALPDGSKARLLREVRLICSSYGGGCDAYLLLPTAIQMPNRMIKINALPVNGPKDAQPKIVKSVQVEVQP